MQTKLLSIVALAFLALGVVVADKNRFTARLSDFLAKASREQQESLMWMRRVLSEQFRWSQLKLKTSEENEDSNLIRGLTHYAADLYWVPYMHSWTYMSEYEAGLASAGNKELEWNLIFQNKILAPCELTPTLAVAAITTNIGELSVYESMWFQVAEVCSKILAHPEQSAKLTYEVAEFNQLLS